MSVFLGKLGYLIIDLKFISYTTFLEFITCLSRIYWTGELISEY